MKPINFFFSLILLFLSSTLLHAQDSTSTIRVRKPTNSTERQYYYCLPSSSNDTVWQVVAWKPRAKTVPDTMTLIFPGNRTTVFIVKKDTVFYVDLLKTRYNKIQFYIDGNLYRFECPNCDSENFYSSRSLNVPDCRIYGEVINDIQAVIYELDVIRRKE